MLVGKPEVNNDSKRRRRGWEVADEVYLTQVRDRPLARCEHSNETGCFVKRGEERNKLISCYDPKVTCYCV